MGKSETKAKEILSLREQGLAVKYIKALTSATDQEWYSYSNKAYNLLLKQARKKRKEELKRRTVSAVSNEEISALLSLNDTLANYALSVPSFVTAKEFEDILELSKGLPSSETKIIELIGDITFDSRMRAMQKRGRIEKFDYFTIFSKIVDAALISYYRTNFISCYFTLIPVIEGIIIRWMGYTENDTKPEFEEIRNFFKNAAVRQPCPHNIQFHEVYVRACDQILNHHLYKPTKSGKAYSNFNRHVASHLLNDDPFATKENCIRLFVLLDTMTEIYLYEAANADPRFSLKGEEFAADMLHYNMVRTENVLNTPEKLILGTGNLDLSQGTA